MLISSSFLSTTWHAFCTAIRFYSVRIIWLTWGMRNEEWGMENTWVAERQNCRISRTRSCKEFWRSGDESKSKIRLLGEILLNEGTPICWTGVVGTHWDEETGILLVDGVSECLQIKGEEEEEEGNEDEEGDISHVLVILSYCSSSLLWELCSFFFSLLELGSVLWKSAWFEETNVTGSEDDDWDVISSFSSILPFTISFFSSVSSASSGSNKSSGLPNEEWGRVEEVETDTVDDLEQWGRVEEVEAERVVFVEAVENRDDWKAEE